MSKWSDLYKKQISESNSLSDFITKKITYKKKLIEIIEKYSKKTKKILEAGCGSGVTSIYLEKAGYKLTGIDSDPDMVKLASSIANQQNSSALFIIDNIKTLTNISDQHFDVVFSNGVLEHFSDSEIIQIINNQLFVSDFVLISIPSDYFSDKDRMYGDERFMSVEEWRLILSKTKGEIIEEFAFDSEKVSGNKHQFIGFVLSAL